MEANFIIKLVMAAIVGLIGWFVLAYSAGTISGI